MPRRSRRQTRRSRRSSRRTSFMLSCSLSRTSGWGTIRAPRRTGPRMRAICSRGCSHPGRSSRKRSVPTLSSYEYAIIRVVPYVDREEFINAGVVLFARTVPFLGARIALDRARLLALAPSVDLVEVERQLALIPLICQGDRSGGPIAELSPPERFH